MSYSITSKTNQEFEVKVTVPVEELQEAARKAAVKLSKSIKIDGFRSGKAPYEIIKKHIGEMKILEEATNDLVAKHLNEILAKEKLDIISQPKVKLEKLAPGNEFIYKATLSLFPEITLPDFSKIKVKKNETKVDESEIKETLEKLRNLRAKEVLENRPARKGDKVEVDYEVYMDGKFIKGGKAKKQGVIIGEGRMIPGFEEQLIGEKAGARKEFDLTFPKDYLPELASKKATFKVILNGVYKRELPELDDEFANGLGKKSIDELKKQIEENLLLEKEEKEEERQELEMLEKIIGASNFVFIPEDLVSNEQDYIFQEMKARIEQGGGKFEDYLKHLNKSEEELKNEFLGEAEKKMKSRLIFRKIVIDNKIKVDDKKIDEEIERQANTHSYSQETVEKIKSQSYRDYLKQMMLNREVIGWLKEKIKLISNF